MSTTSNPNDTSSIPGTSIPGSSPMGPQLSDSGKSSSLVSPSSAQTGGRGGGGSGLAGTRKRAEEEERRKNAEFEKDKADYQKKLENEEEPEAAPAQNVLLRDLRWETQNAALGEKAFAQVSADLPDDAKNLTRILFTLQFKEEKGSWKDISLAEGHLQSGIAAASMELTLPPGEKPDAKGEAEFRFMAEHSRSREYLGPTLRTGPGESDFEGDIFYSPAYGDYLLLPLDEADRAEFERQMEAVLKHAAALDRLAKISDAKKREIEAEKEAEAIAGLFGGGSSGKAGVFEELVQVRISKKWGNRKGWIYITPHMRKNAEVKGHWRKGSDAVLKKSLDRMLKRGGRGKETPPWFGGKFSHSFFKTEPKAGSWPWPWHYPPTGGGTGKKEGDGDIFTFSAEAAACRYVAGFNGVETSFDPKNGKLVLATGGHASWAAFEGRLSGKWEFPDGKGFDLLQFLRVKSTKRLSDLLDPKKQCWFLATVEASATAFVGLSVSAMVKFPAIDLSGGKEGRKAEVGAGGKAFAGGEAGGGISLKGQWKSLQAEPWKTLGKTGGTILGIAGAAAEAELKIEYRNGKFYYRHALGAALGLGMRNRVEWELDPLEGFELIGHLANSVRFHRLLNIDEETYEACRVAALTWITEGEEVAKGLSQKVIAEARVFNEWLRKWSDRAELIKARISQKSSIQRSMLAKCPDHAIAQAMVTVMEKFASDDFRVLLLLMGSADSGHKLKWILRRVAAPSLSTGKDEDDAEKERLLREGIRKILAYPATGLKNEDAPKQKDFQNEFKKMLHEKSIRF